MSIWEDDVGNRHRYLGIDALSLRAEIALIMVSKDSLPDDSAFQAGHAEAEGCSLILTRSGRYNHQRCRDSKIPSARRRPSLCCSVSSNRVPLTRPKCCPCEPRGYDTTLQHLVN
jgi:hypothetical protein